LNMGLILFLDDSYSPFRKRIIKIHDIMFVEFLIIFIK